MIEMTTTNDTALTYVGNQGRAQGAAYFSRLEGSYYENGTIYFTSTQGGGPAETSTGPIADGFGNARQYTTNGVLFWQKTTGTVFYFANDKLYVFDDKQIRLLDSPEKH